MQSWEAARESTCIPATGRVSHQRGEASLIQESTFWSPSGGSLASSYLSLGTRDVVKDLSTKGVVMTFLVVSKNWETDKTSNVWDLII